MMSENLEKIHVIEYKILILSSLTRLKEEKGELKNEADPL